MCNTVDAIAGCCEVAGWVAGAGSMDEFDPMEARESSKRPADSAKSSSDRDRIGDGERALPAATFRGLSDGAGRRCVVFDSAAASEASPADAVSTSVSALGTSLLELSEPEPELAS